MKYRINNKKQGFTMVEMLVSVAIFSVVITIVMGTIVTIVDTSRKARTMTEVMNNLNFSFESMTRTLKTAKSIDWARTNNDTIVAIDQNDKEIVYSFSTDRITKNIDGAGAESITSEDLKLSSWKIEKFKSGVNSDRQPRIFFSVKGRVETTKGIASEFNLQSTVSQRRLNLD